MSGYSQKKSIKNTGLMKIFCKLDEKDRKILEILKNNPEISQKEIAKFVALSQPSVGARIRKMKKSGILHHTYGIDMSNSGFYIFKVNLKCRKPDELLKKFENCPFFLNGFVVAGNNNLTMMFIGEDIVSLEAIIDNHLRRSPHVIDIDLGIIVSGKKRTVIPISIRVSQDDKSPCGSDCGSCEYYENKICLGCPVTGYYRGNVWKY